MKKKIIIIGAGPGGLTAGMLLAHRGQEVLVLEKNEISGGRNGSIKLGEYKFDIGPTFLMMKNILDEVFSSTGRKIEDYLKCTQLSPIYRLYYPQGNWMDIFSEEEKMLSEMKRVFPGEEKGLAKFSAEEKKRLDRLYPILARDNNNLLDAASPEFVKALPYFSFGKTLFEAMGDYFEQDFARLSFTFQSKYLGMSPWECPAAFAMVPYIEHSAGIYHVEGGLSEISEAMAKVICEDGGEVRYGAKVKKLLVEEKKVIGVEMENGEKILADEVVVNADFSYFADKLVDEGILKKYAPEKLAKKKYSCSIFMLYLGVDKKYDLKHHTISFAREYRKNVDDIFAGRLTENDFSFYVRDASQTDPTLAPKGKSALYVLVPVPNNRAGIDWEKKKTEIRKQSLNLMKEKLGMNDIEEHIEVEKIITPTDWENDFNVYTGAVFNLSHHLDQMIWFRPHNKFEELEHCYLVGGGTHPGSGLPTIYMSGRIVADLISKKA